MDEVPCQVCKQPTLSGQRLCQACQELRIEVHRLMEEAKARRRSA
jgi:hypothetical protein